MFQGTTINMEICRDSCVMLFAKKPGDSSRSVRSARPVKNTHTHRHADSHAHAHTHPHTHTHTHTPRARVRTHAHTYRTRELLRILPLGTFGHSTVQSRPLSIGSPLVLWRNTLKLGVAESTIWGSGNGCSCSWMVANARSRSLLRRNVWTHGKMGQMHKCTWGFCD